MSSAQTDRTVEVRQGEELNHEALHAYLNSHLEGFDSITGITQFPGGYSNLTYLVNTNLGDFVLRRPPFGANIKSAHDMGREFKVLSLLKPHFPKVPEPILFEESGNVLGAPFYIMERVSGVILRNRLPKGLEIDESTNQDLCHSLVDCLVSLHAINLESSGLENFGKPEGFVQRQVEGWTKRYYKAETESISAMDEMAKWMPENLPVSGKPTFIHNDYKFDNLVLSVDNLPEILAVLDWEMATVGDPLMDLGTTLAYWAQADDHPALKAFIITHLQGMLTRQEVLNLYAQKSGRSVDGFLFYYVFGCFKIGVIGQQIYARFVKGFTKDPRFGELIHLIKAISGNGVKAMKTGKI